MKSSVNFDDIGERVKKLRKKNGLTQKQLAELFGYSTDTIKKWENGINGINLEVLETLKRTLHTSYDYLLEGKENQSSLEKVLQEINVLTVEDKLKLLTTINKECIQAYIEKIGDNSSP